MQYIGQTPIVAYLASQYPAVSHTFILREVLALQNLGLDVQTCSIQRMGPEHMRGPDERAAANRTFYVKDTARKVWPLLAAQTAMFTHPARYFGALALAWRTRSVGAKSLLYQMFYFVEATLLARHLQRQKVTHLHSHFAQSGTSVALLAAHLAGVPYSFTLHGPADLDAPKDWRLDIKVARARFVACISHYARSQTMRYADPAHWDKLKIIHCGVVPDRYEAATANNHTGTRLLFVGRLSPVKGLRILLAALQRAHQTDPDLSLTIVGDGPDRTALETMARPLGDAVTFTGYQSQEEVAAHLATSDILVLPSFAEGVPVVLMEAMASAKPVICTQVAGVSELVEDGISGHIVPPGNIEALAKRVVDLARAPADRARMGQAGRQKVRESFNVRIEAARLATLFQTVDSVAIRPVPFSAPR